MNSYIQWEGIWEFTHVRDGKVIWQEESHNALTNQGEQIMLDSFFRSQNSPTQFYFRLANDSLDKGDTLTTLSGEPVANGYAPQLLTRDTTGFPTLEVSDGDYRIVSRKAEFLAAGGTIGPVNTAFLATTIDNTGILIAFAPMTLSRTIQDGDKLFGSMRIKLKS